MKITDKYSYKVLSRVVNQVNKRRGGDADYPYFIIVLLMLRYFYQVFNSPVGIVRGGDPPQDLFYKTTAEQFDIFTFYMMYEQSRWSYYTQADKSISLTDSLLETIENMKYFFANLKESLSYFDNVIFSDEALLREVIRDIDRIDYRVNGVVSKDLLGEIMSYVLLLFSRNKDR